MSLKVIKQNKNENEESAMLYQLAKQYEGFLPDDHRRLWLPRLSSCQAWSLSKLESNRKTQNRVQYTFAESSSATSSLPTL